MDAAAIVRRARSHSGLSLRELARRAGTSHATLSAYEHGRKAPSVDTLDRIVHAAGFRLGSELVPAVRGPRDLTRGDELAEVLELASQFPARHEAELAYPIFGRPPASPVRSR